MAVAPTRIHPPEKRRQRRIHTPGSLLAPRLSCCALELRQAPPRTRRCRRIFCWASSAAAMDGMMDGVWLRSVHLGDTWTIVFDFIVEAVLSCVSIKNPKKKISVVEKSRCEWRSTQRRCECESEYCDNCRTSGSPSAQGGCWVRRRCLLLEAWGFRTMRVAPPPRTYRIIHPATKL